MSVIHVFGLYFAVDLLLFCFILVGFWLWILVGFFFFFVGSGWGDFCDVLIVLFVC